MMGSRTPFPPLTKGAEDCARWLTEQIRRLPEGPRAIVRDDLFESYGFTDIRQSRIGNQDRALIARSKGRFTSDSWFFAVVCDGVGGSAEGDKAAAAAASYALVALLSSSHVNPVDALPVAMNFAHERVREMFGSRSSTTFVSVLVTPHAAAVGWVGDSRAYQLLQTALPKKLTDDDTLAVQLEASGLSEQLSEEFEDRLSQAIGGDNSLKPHVRGLNRSASEGGLLLCTDGVWKTLGDTLGVLAAHCSASDELGRRLMFSSDWHGGHDNATAIIVPSIARIQQRLAEETQALPEDSCIISLPGVSQTFLQNSQFRSSYAYYLRERREAQHEAAPTVEKTTSGTKKPKRRKIEEAQLVIEEDPIDDPSDASITLPPNPSAA